MDSLRHWRASAPVSQDGLQPLDWPGLCARLAADRQLARALAKAGAAARSASFDPAAARVLALAGKGSPLVNPAASESRNGEADITAVAWQPRSG